MTDQDMLVEGLADQIRACQTPADADQVVTKWLVADTPGAPGSFRAAAALIAVMDSVREYAVELVESMTPAEQEALVGAANDLHTIALHAYGRQR